MDSLHVTLVVVLIGHVIGWLFILRRITDLLEDTSSAANDIRITGIEMRDNWTSAECTKK